MEQDGDYDNIFEQFQNYRRDNIFCDATIVTEKAKFPVHKNLLSANSLYFKRLFTGNTNTNVQVKIFTKGVKKSAVSTCLKFIYRERFDIKMNEVSDLLHAACLFQLERLKQKCMEIIQKNIDVSNVQTQTIIIQHADKLLQDDKIIKTLSADTMTMMVKSEDLSVSDESVIFEALVKWIANDEEQRKDEFCKMLEFIRLPVMDRDYFSDVVCENNHIQKECQTCKKYFTESAQFVMSGKKRDLKDYQIKERFGIKHYVKGENDHYSEIIVMNKRNNRTSINKFNVENDSLSSYIPNDQITINKCPQHFCIHNNALFCLDLYSSTKLLRYKDGKWNELPHLINSQNLSYAHLTSYKGFILVIGSNNSNKVFCLNVTKNKWVNFPNMNNQHSYSSSVVYCNCVYVMGEWFPLSSSSSVELFDANSNRWKIMPSMNNARYGHASTVYQDKIFVAGGCNKVQRLTSVETFHNNNEGDNTWTSIKSLNVSRRWLSIFVHNNKLYAFGGWRNNGSSLYENFDEESNSWEKSYDVQNDEVKMCRVFVK